MEKKISSIGIILITILIIGAIFSIEIVIKLNEKHEEKLKYALTSKVEYAYKRCLLEEKCEDVTTLNNLYQNGYLTKLVNPITKEVIDVNTTIKKVNEKIVISWEL